MTVRVFLYIPPRPVPCQNPAQGLTCCFTLGVRAYSPMGAESAVTAADVVYLVSELADLLRGRLSFGHCQYPCHYVSITWRCSACSAGSPCSLAPTAPRTPGSSSCATRSPAAAPGEDTEAVVGRPGSPGRVGCQNCGSGRELGF